MLAFKDVKIIKNQKCLVRSMVFMFISSGKLDVNMYGRSTLKQRGSSFYFARMEMVTAKILYNLYNMTNAQG